MNSNNLERYSATWARASGYVLHKIDHEPNDPYIDRLRAAGAEYVIYAKLAVGYSILYIHEVELVPAITAKMIAAGVEVLDQPFDHKYEKHISRLWDKLERYSSIWAHPSEYILHKIDHEPNDPYIDRLRAAGAEYVIYAKFPLGESSSVYIHEVELAPVITAKMIAAGVEVLDQPIDWDYERHISRLWTDRIDEYILVSTEEENPYVVFHPASQASLEFSDERDYQMVIDNMLKAGVKVVDDFPDIE